MKDSHFPSEAANRAKAVSEAAFLANLLALEASIETAGAGECACESVRIAEDVRALAQCGAQAAARTF